jgi:hypothetical protein
MHLEMSTFAPAASPVKIETSSVINEPHAPTAATAGPSAKNASTATSDAWKRMLIVLVTINGNEKVTIALKIGPCVKEFLFIVTPLILVGFIHYVILYYAFFVLSIRN